MKRSVFFSVLLWLLFLSALLPAAESKVEKLSFGWGGANRTYYLYVPEKAAAGNAPLLLLLHGSGRNGKSQTDQWTSLAKSEGIVLVAPDSSDSSGWRIPEEGPQFFYDLLEMVRITHDVIDGRRMYIFGHSAGAIHGLGMGLLESEYFAAVAAHAGVVTRDYQPFLTQAPRKTPMAIWVGTNDSLFPVNNVRATRDALNANGFDTRLTEIAGHTHNYYSRSGHINKEVWAFLKDKKLASDPQYQQYSFMKPK